MNCLKCKNKQTVCHRESPDSFDMQEIFPGFVSIYDWESVIKNNNFFGCIVKCANCKSIWFVEISHNNASYTDFNRSDPRDSAPDSYGSIAIDAKIIGEDDLEDYKNKLGN